MLKPQYVISVKRNEEELGEILIELFPDVAPKHVENFDSLVEEGFYNGTVFHRIIPGFMIQGGDPNTKNKPKSSWGMGDPKQKKVPAEFSKVTHERGIVSAARSQDPNSASSQFFICVEDCKFLDGQYSVFGKVLDGMDIVDEVVMEERDQQDIPMKKIEMNIRKIQ